MNVSHSNFIPALCHFTALSTISANCFSFFHPRIDPALVLSATKKAGSPGRRSTTSTSPFICFWISWTTSFTLNPSADPRLEFSTLVIRIFLYGKSKPLDDVYSILDTVVLVIINIFTIIDVSSVDLSSLNFRLTVLLLYAIIILTVWA